MQVSFGQANNPQKILDCGPDGAWIAIQVLDANTLFFDQSRDILQAGGAGAAAPNSSQGFQLKQAQGILLMRWEGELWAMSNAAQAIINIAITFHYKKGGCGCKGSVGAAAAPGNPSGVADPQIDEGI